MKFGYWLMSLLQYKKNQLQFDISSQLGIFAHWYMYLLEWAELELMRINRYKYK